MDLQRTIRPAPAQAVADRLVIPHATLARFAHRDWWRLYKIGYPNQFYPSRGSRLTPISGKIPCVYIGPAPETAVAEVWGDRFYAQKQKGSAIYRISSREADQYGFLKLRAPLPALKLCDLTDTDTRLVLGIDSAALYSTELSIPQAWAEVIAQHPLRFDGIIYRSRHTDEECMVLWALPGRRALDHELTFDLGGPFRDSRAAYILAAKMGLRLSFPETASRT